MWWYLLVLATRGWIRHGNLTTLDGPGSGRYTQIRVAEDGFATIVWNGVSGLRLCRCTDVFCTSTTKPINVLNSSGACILVTSTLRFPKLLNSFCLPCQTYLFAFCRPAGDESAICAHGNRWQQPCTRVWDSKFDGSANDFLHGSLLQNNADYNSAGKCPEGTRPHRLISPP